MALWNEISHNRELRKLQCAQERTRKEDNKHIEEAVKSGADQIERGSLKHEAFINGLYYDDKIHALQARYLTNKAASYLLPRPPFDKESGDWEESDVTGRWRLTLPAQAALRSVIDDYEKRRRERVQSWLVVMSGFIGASTGLIGALIGLIAISG